MNEVDSVWTDEVKHKVLDTMMSAGVPEFAMAECGQSILVTIIV